jgi:hypothetical protein
MASSGKSFSPVDANFFADIFAASDFVNFLSFLPTPSRSYPGLMARSEAVEDRCRRALIRGMFPRRSPL